MQLKFDIAGFMEKTKSASEAAINEGLDEVFPLTQSRVPVKTGDLKSTGRVLKAKVYKNAVSGKVRYGNKRINYGGYVEIDAHPSYLRVPLRSRHNDILDNFNGKLK